jgi:uncharacterized protein YyaL (SSP411 family)
MLMFGFFSAFGQKLYDPAANADEQIVQAIAEAKQSKRHVFIQVGGNWCTWCIRYHNFVESHTALKALTDANYVTVKMNYSKENYNREALKKLGNPQRFGFPVFVILNGDGSRLHTQNSAYLEENGTYSEAKISAFLKHWSPAAVAPETYAEK